MTSLTGAPKQVNTICIDGLNKLIDLRGLKDTNANFLTVNNCAGLTSLDGMPTHVRDIISLNGLNDDFVVKFPHGTSMSQGGQLRIGGSLAHRLSPTLVTVPGLSSIDWHHESMGYRDDILEIFNKHLKLPKTTHTYLGLQTELIDADMDFVTEL